MGCEREEPLEGFRVTVCLNICQDTRQVRAPPPSYMCACPRAGTHTHTHLLYHLPTLTEQLPHVKCSPMAFRPMRHFNSQQALGSNPVIHLVYK